MFTPRQFFDSYKSFSTASSLVSASGNIHTYLWWVSELKAEVGGLMTLLQFFCCSINTVYYMAPYATMILSIPALLLEGAGVLKWAEVQTSLLLPVLIIVLSGVSAFCLNFSIFYVIHTTTAVTFNVAGNMKVCSCFSPQYLVQNANCLLVYILLASLYIFLSPLFW